MQLYYKLLQIRVGSKKLNAMYAIRKIILHEYVKTTLTIGKREVN